MWRGATADQASADYNGLFRGRRGLWASIGKRGESDGTGGQTGAKSTSEGSSHRNLIIHLMSGGAETQLSLEKLGLTGTPDWRSI